ncbi:MAG: hypothetical protein HYY31_02110 [Chloroflexi bacterium]|nr:hypothetical protein [Chloroflexota bacterium]
MSKLIERLERLRKAGPPRLGFGATAHRERLAPMLLIVSVADPKQLKEAASAPTDAILLDPSAWESPTPSRPDPAPGAPWGVAVKGISSEEITALRDKGCDFIAFEAASAPLEALKGEEMGRILIIPPQIDEQQARALENVPVDMVLLFSPTRSPITLQSLLATASLRRQIGKPFLLSASTPLSPWELQCLRDIGVDGIVVTLEKGGTATLEALRTFLDQLPSRTPKRERFTPLIPQGAFNIPERPARTEEAEPEEDDE